MTEENKYIFPAGGDALVYLTGPMHKKYSTTFAWGHPFSTHVYQDRFFNPFPPCTHMYSFRVIPFCLCDFIDLILFSPILTLLVCHSFRILFYLRNSRTDVFVSDTHHFLASHSVSSSLPWKVFLLMVASNCQLFYFS